mgnify:FL=1
MNDASGTRRPKPSPFARHPQNSGGAGQSIRNRLKLDVLLVEDDRADATLMRELLDRSRFFEFQVEHVQDIAAARQALAATHFDLMILDFWVGSESSLSLLKRSLQQSWNMPSLLVSSIDVADVQGLGLEAGAYGYLHKNDLAPSTLDSAIRTLLHMREAEANLRRSLAENVRDQDRLAETVNDVTQEVLSAIDAVQSLGEALLKPDGERPPKLDPRSQAQAMQEGSRRLADILETRLGRARTPEKPARLRLEQVDIIDILRSVVATMLPTCEDKEQELSLDASTPCLMAEADAAAVRQLFLNLIENAHRYSPRKTRIDVIARLTDGRARVSVVDQGVGMSKAAIAEAMQRRAFAELPSDFMTAGHGLGLAVAVDIVDMHDGVIDFESQQDWGTTVAVSLPTTRQRLN